MSESRSSAPARLPDFVEPMKAKLVDSLRAGDWIYEIKLDGYRALVLRGGSETQVVSRNEKDLGDKFPEVKYSIVALQVRDTVINGEIVALDEKGRSSFQLLQAYAMEQERPPAVSTHLICSGSTATICETCPSKNERRSWNGC